MKRILLLIAIVTLAIAPLVSQTLHRNAYWIGTADSLHWTAVTIPATSTIASDFEVMNNDEDSSWVWTASVWQDTLSNPATGTGYGIPLRPGEGWTFSVVPPSTIIYVKSSSSAPVTIYRYQGR